MFSAAQHHIAAFNNHRGRRCETYCFKTASGENVHFWLKAQLFSPTVVSG